ncbi:hypothetical protein M430DRAFT_30029 [Amorphotheca resinae ATCC 22711]|uniref:Major facilitator superfamily (MFS) profile domain-containing protein n=1 Tax=Amorphotheca resinae ATCC 22711 TaxID=857342 RepID=A0A2T3AUG0_AMORE|nr:hypothetical protein M430DRAFT_30029 [Amorphotheca resinae ATCC 22711]PSS12319.1 hypothetical protein M430DRAFT_30029 [Amorphotheca resinae ATCC 22711]
MGYIYIYPRSTTVGSPYACAAMFTIAVGFLADSTGQRGVCNIIFSLIRVVGFAMLLGSQRSHVKYAEGVYKHEIVLESSSAGVISMALLVATYTSTLPNSRTGMRQSWLIRLPACLQEYDCLPVCRKHPNDSPSTQREYSYASWKVRPLGSKQEAERLSDNRPDFLYAI